MKGVNEEKALLNKTLIKQSDIEFYSCILDTKQ